MNLDILHYHLQPGGVTRIIESQITALKDDPRINALRLVVGSAPNGTAHASVRLVVEPALDYLPEDWPAERYRSEAARLEDFFGSRLGAAEIVHAHNPTLGKNPLLTYALSRMAESGQALFYHCHDFAERRPDRSDFLTRVLGDCLGRDPKTVTYPHAPMCRFGVLNSRDFGFLLGLGIARARVHFLPNPVQFQEEDLSLDPKESRDRICRRFGLPEESTIFLYPVRVIRRKNIGELILFSRLFAGRACWLVTMAPHNPREKDEYERWKAFVHETRAPVVFEAGSKLPFPVLMSGSDRIVTTSVQEGFGMSYLESWLFGKPVVGRNIDYVTRDFVEEGLVLDHLYDRIPVKTEKGEQDFSVLQPAEQRKLILRTSEGGRTPSGIAEMPGLHRALFGETSDATLAHNRDIVRDKYSLESYGKRLTGIYEKLS